MKTILDIETTTKGPDRSPSPYWPQNYMVSVGVQYMWKGNKKGYEKYWCAQNNHKESDNFKGVLQEVLRGTTLLIGHNIKFDLAWLLECGFEYSGKTYDTMIYEYLIAGGQKTIRLNLNDSCKRYGIEGKDEKARVYFDSGTGYEDMPWDVVKEYGRQDVEITRQLYLAQMEELKDKPMGKALDLMNDFCYVLTQMERNGITIDVPALKRLEVEYTEERNALQLKLEALAREALGDTPFKLTSNDDLSALIFSRKPLVKKMWAEYFNLGSELIHGTVRPKKPREMSKKKLGEAIITKSCLTYKTSAAQCKRCKGGGKVAKILKSGHLGKMSHKCPMCNGVGIVYTYDTNTIAGFKQAPSSVHDLAAHGYKCGKDVLIRLAGKAKDEKARKFLQGMVRFNAISSYLTTYVAGIKNAIAGGTRLHTNFMQCVTATGRLSSRAPNFHNQPRGGTFPIRAVVVSRWEKGTITEGDYSQLEFRVAVALAHDAVAIKDIESGIDIHNWSAKVLTEAGQETNRQDAKAHTFKPLYGGTEGTTAERAYYRAFLVKYHGIANWHKRLLETACVFKSISIPSGRRYIFPWVRRSAAGSISGGTKIKNYPVQGFATADIVPLACTLVYWAMQKAECKSVLINEVHDSIVIDTYPSEEKIIVKILRECMEGVIPWMEEHWSYDFIVPLAVDIKSGPNWLEMKEVI